MENKRVYQVAKEFHISSEALISMLKEMKFETKSHMSVVDKKMFTSIKNQFDKQHDAAIKDIQKKKKITEAIRKKVVTGEATPASTKRKKKRKRHRTDGTKIVPAAGVNKTQDQNREVKVEFVVFPHGFFSTCRLLIMLEV